MSAPGSFSCKSNSISHERNCSRDQSLRVSFPIYNNLTVAGTQKTGHKFVHSNFKMADEVKVGFLGGGNMAKAIARGFITSRMVKAENLIASATTTKTLSVWKVK